MSNKNLKIYKIQFSTEISTLYFPFKHPCKLRVVWKRSNESAETTLQPLQNGIVNFNQMLRLQVNMYYDTMTNRFVEKKCIYNVIIVSQKGEKSAGNVTFDLAQFFNRRVYEIKQDFPLEKCPVANTKITMKISYEESIEGGYDSFSKISAYTNLDTSTSSAFDVNQFNSKDKLETMSMSSSKQQESQQSTGNPSVHNEGFDQLSEVDIDTNVKSRQGGSSKIGDNIKSISSLTNKINEFVAQKSAGIKKELQEAKRRESLLKSQISAGKHKQDELNKQITDAHLQYQTLLLQLTNFKSEAAKNESKQVHKIHELQQKQARHLKQIEQLQLSMNQTGASQEDYISQLKIGHLEVESQLKAQIEEMEEVNLQLKKQKDLLSINLKKLEAQFKDISQKSNKSSSRNQQLQYELQQRGQELEQARISLDKAYKNLMEAFDVM